MKKILLTGSTCSGKTSVLNEISKKGNSLFPSANEDTTILICPEAAYVVIEKLKMIGFNKENPVTDLFNKVGEKTGLYYFQKAIFEESVLNEKNVESVAKELEEKGKNVIIIYDRCLLDGQAFCSDAVFNSIIKVENNFIGYEHEIIDFKKNELNKFDTIIHLESIASDKRKYKWVGGSKEEGTFCDFRKESPEEATKLDSKIKTIYYDELLKDLPQFEANDKYSYIDNASFSAYGEESFNHKMQKVFEIIDYATMENIKDIESELEEDYE